MNMSFDSVEKFENLIADFFGSKYAVATDSCTHAIELCLRYQNINKVEFPKHTYVGIPLLGFKLGLNWQLIENRWKNFYTLSKTNIIDAAVLWKKNSYIKGTMMCLSFQYQKHLNIGRGGMILLDNKMDYNNLIKLSYDGRQRNKPWRKQNISKIGYHYYMTPENAELGINIFSKVKNKNPKNWSWLDYPDLSKMKVFKSK